MQGVSIVSGGGKRGGVGVVMGSDGTVVAVAAFVVATVAATLAVAVILAFFCYVLFVRTLYGLALMYCRRSPTRLSLPSLSTHPIP